jgi:ubiquinone/menaquinone biosynthesis C-methylase UbiE
VSELTLSTRPSYRSVWRGRRQPKFPWKDGIRYFAADFNRCNLPRRAYDAVFFHQSLHHVAYVERLFAQVWRTLKPSGLLYLDEYIGSSEELPGFGHDSLSTDSKLRRVKHEIQRMFGIRGGYVE